MSNIAILGCGPAGLFAAHAAVQQCHNVRVFSNKRISEQFGAQYLHENIPGLTPDEPDLQIGYRLKGSIEGYAQKVYGEVPPDFVSPGRLVGEHPGWDIRAAYKRAWDLYDDIIIPVEPFTARSLGGAVNYGVLEEADLVISTIPARSICYRPMSHTFSVRDAWAIGDAPERRVRCPIRVPESMVICDGTEETGWYRASMIQGFATTEWSSENKPPIDDVALIQKVVRTNCDCWREHNFWRAGRYGTWNKSVLTHEAYWATLTAFQVWEGSK